jgi:hypothetical protein
MTRYSVRQVTDKPVDLQDDQVITIMDAARLLGVNKTTVSQALNRGAFTVVVDSQATNPQKGHRLLLRAEVEARAAGVPYRAEVPAAEETTLAETPQVQYVVNPSGQPTAAIVPLPLWETLLDAARRSEDPAAATATGVTNPHPIPRRRRINRLFADADRLAALELPPLTDAELETEIQAERAGE